ncbi:MAG: DMT family transporter [Chitinophagaceae bacterium]|jgi:drug/metabolite transporter (DMT)-like permease|nr:DMT family transporter [Chitinophagaceae bacterium]
MNRHDLINWSIFIFLALIWGSSFILMKISSEGLTAVEIAAVRIFSAGLVFLPFSINHLHKLPSKKISLVILTGVTGNLIPAFFFAEAIANNIDSALAAILNSLTPLFVVVLGILFFKLKILPIKIAGVLVGLMGLVLLTLSQRNLHIDNLGYATLVLLASISYGFNVNLVSHFLKDVNPIHAATVSLAFMCLPTGSILWQQDFFQTTLIDHTLFWPIMASVLLGVMGSAIATAFFYILVKRAGGLFSSTITYGIPFVAMGWGIIYNEEVTWVQVACLSVILGGVYLTNKK